MSHCSDCQEKATHKCSICTDIFCEECAKRHLMIYKYENPDAKMIKLEPTDAKTL